MDIRTEALCHIIENILIPLALKAHDDAESKYDVAKSQEREDAKTTIPCTFIADMHKAQMRWHEGQMDAYQYILKQITELRGMSDAYLEMCYGGRKVG